MDHRSAEQRNYGSDLDLGAWELLCRFSANTASSHSENSVEGKDANGILDGLRQRYCALLSLVLCGAQPPLTSHTKHRALFP